MTKPNILFLADTTHPAGAVHDHIQAITSNESLSWHVINPLVCKTVDKIDFGHFDAIGIHYSIKIYNNYYLSLNLKRKISEYMGTKFIFLQDEYQRVNEAQSILARLGMTLLFTLVDQQIIKKAYPDQRLIQLKLITVLTGYVSQQMKSLINVDIKRRSIDVSYRGRRCDYWLGSLAYEKQYIAEQFCAEIKGKGLVSDISIEETDRIYGDAWFSLLQNSKAVLGTESGASVWDFDRSIEKNTKIFLRKNRNAKFSDVYESILKPVDGQILYSAISPRVFEAAATKTPMIMFPGTYSNVCIPDRHYIALEKDFSNIAEVLEKLKDHEFLQQMADDTYNDLIVSDLYSQKELSRIVSQEILKSLQHQDFHSNNEVTKQIHTILGKNKTINTVRVFLTEFKFIITNFFNLLFDSKYSMGKRMKRVINGLKRYFTYLLPRFKN